MTTPISVEMNIRDRNAECCTNCPQWHDACNSRIFVRFSPLFLEIQFMSFRMLQVGCFAIAVSFGLITTKSVQAQYPFPSGPSCSGGYNQSYYGQQGFGSGYGQPGGFSSPGGNYVSNYYGGQPSYATQPPMGYGAMGYGGGYAQPAVNLNQSFYPGSYNNSPSQQYEQRPSHHPHHSHHGWHLGHYLLGI